MIWLVDTNVLIEAARSRPHPAVQRWLARTPAERLVLCPVALAEYLAGALRLPPPSRQAALAFLRGCRAGWAWVPLDTRTAICWGSLRAAHRARPRVNDLWLAATAKAHGLAVATRNVRDFQPYGVRLFNPFL